MQRIGELEERYVKEVLDTQFRSSKGSMMTKRCEEAFAKSIGATYAISFCNGTVSLHTALEAKGIGPGDEVIVPPLTMSSTTFAVLQCGAIPIFADVDENTFQISPEAIESLVTERTKAIITVALYGLCPDMDAIMKIANQHNLFVLEDDAEAYGAEYKGRKVGTLGHAASFSFQSSKHLTAGEGGMIVTGDLSLAKKIRQLGSLGYAGIDAQKGKITKEHIQDPNYSRHVSMGWNYRMSELCAAVALAQIERAEELVSARRHAGEKISEVFDSCDWLRGMKVGPEYRCSYWTAVAYLDRPDVSWYEFRDCYKRLGGHGIYAAWKLTYLEPMFENMNLVGRNKNLEGYEYKRGLCPTAEKLQPQLLQFKTNYWNESELMEQIDVLKETIAWFDRNR